MLIKTRGESRKCQSEEQRARVYRESIPMNFNFCSISSDFDRFRPSVDEKNIPTRKTNSDSANICED